MAIDSPSYVIVGRGIWAQRMTQVLASEDRRASAVTEARRAPSESVSGYEARLREQFASSAAQIAWLCVPPGTHVSTMIRAAISAGLHVVAEKPWFGTPQETAQLAQMAREQRR